MKNIELKWFRKTKISIFFLMSFVICFVVLFEEMNVVSAETVYVATDGSGDYNCDGVDDQTEINQAMNNASVGDIVHIKAGTYILNYGFDAIFASGSIDMKDGVILEGEDDKTILRLKDGYNYTEYIGLISSSKAGRTTDITIRNLCLDANLANTPDLRKGVDGSYGILIFGAQNCLIDGVRIENTSLDGIAISRWSSNNLTIKNCNIQKIGHDGIFGHVSLDNCLIENNYIDVLGGAQGNGNKAIRVGGDNLTIRNNTAIGGWSAINGGGNNIIIENNRVSAVIAAGIEFGGSNVTIKNNVIYDVSYGMWTPSGIGIHLSSNPSNIYILSNTIDGGAGGDGIRIEDGDGIHIKNNIITDWGDYGINNIDGSNVFASYNNITNSGISNYNGVSPGPGSISEDPLFASVTRTDMVLDENNDFRLKSQYGRWNDTTWVNDDVTSPCIDAGEPSSNYSNEPSPNGGRINIGAYGNTNEASKSYIYNRFDTEIEVLVYPNPYRDDQGWPEKVTFNNLPAEATMRIYAISGELVKIIKHKATVDGGSEEWDVSDIASGVYIYSIISPSGNKEGKISIIK